MAKRKGAQSDNVPATVSPAIDQAIRIVRGQKVLLDEQLAGFYGVPTGVLVQAVKRNVERFPDDFMFRLSRDEWTALRSQIVILETGRGRYRKYLPYAFTEQGVAMLSGVLRSRRAAEVNIQIMRAFVRLRQLLAAHRDLSDRLAKLEERMRRREHAVDRQFEEVFRLLDELFDPPDPPHKPIGFDAELEDPRSQAKRPKIKAKRVADVP